MLQKNRFVKADVHSIEVLCDINWQVFGPKLQKPER